MRLYSAYWFLLCTQGHSASVHHIPQSCYEKPHARTQDFALSSQQKRGNHNLMSTRLETVSRCKRVVPASQDGQKGQQAEKPGVTCRSDGLHYLAF